MLKYSEKRYEQVANPEELSKIAETETAEEPTSPRFDQEQVRALLHLSRNLAESPRSRYSWSSRGWESRLGGGVVGACNARTSLNWAPSGGHLVP